MLKLQKLEQSPVFPLTCLVLLHLFSLLPQAGCSQVDLPTVVIREETPINATVANFASLLRLSLPIRADSVSNHFDKQFGVRPNGSIFVNSRIDLDELSVCAEPGANDSVCCKTYTAMVGDASNWPKFRICTVDENEYVPTFFDGPQPVGAILVEQFENEKNQKLALRLSLRDHDFTAKKLRSFSFFLANNSDNDTRLLFGNHLSSTKPTNITVSSESVVLKLARSLDREERAVYNFTLLACETLNLSRCGRLNVTLRVNDQNDNEPQFVQSEYSFNLNESAVGLQDHSVGYVSALDVDTAENTYTHYDISEVHCDEPNSETNEESRVYAELFSIDQNGRIFVSSSASDLLDYELCKRVSFLVRAWDTYRADPESRGVEERSTARVTVNILNADDAPPQIRFEMKDVIILENQVNLTNALPVRIVVSDPDSLKADVSCNLVHGAELQFRLKSSALSGIDSQEFVLYATQPLDRESQAEVHVTVECTDRVGNRNRSTLAVNVLDENDNTPIFNFMHDAINANGLPVRDGEIEALINENNQPNAFVIRINAHDKDAGSNGEVEYAFLNQGIAQNRSGSFGIDSQSGEIFALERFDREQNESFRLIVAAMDRGRERRTASATLIVRVLDENDNPPRFTERSYRFKILESSKLDANEDSRSRLIGRLTVIDPDTKDLHTFTVVNDSSRFSINEAGEVFTNVPLDREDSEEYSFVVQASDGDHTDSTLVHVELIDRDDNLPEFVFPNRATHNNTVMFECPLEVSSANREFYVTQLIAIDRDGDPAHRQIAYALADARETAARKLFNVDEFGKVWYLRPPNCVTGTFELTVEAFRPDGTDRSRGASTEAQLLVLVTESPSQSQFSPDGASAVRPSYFNRDTAERESTAGNIGLSQMLIALAVGAVIVVIAILVLLLVVARLHHRERARAAQRADAASAERKRKRRKMMEARAQGAAFRQCVVDETKQRDETDAEFDEESLPNRIDREDDEDDVDGDAVSSARNASECDSATYSNANVHATSAMTGRSNYVYHSVAARNFQLATLTNNNVAHDVDELGRRRSCSSVCSACASTSQQQLQPLDERYHVLMRASDEYDTAVDLGPREETDSHVGVGVGVAATTLTRCNPAACACVDCAMVLQNRGLAKTLAHQDLVERDREAMTSRMLEESTRNRYASVNVTLSRRERELARNAERIYVHHMSNASCFTTRPDRSQTMSARCGMTTECENPSICIGKLSEGQPSVVNSTTMQKQQKVAGAHGTISFV